MNSVVAINKLRQNGCTQCDTFDVNPLLNHVPCAEYAILSAKQFFDQFVHIDSCNGPSGINDLTNAMVTVYPNPAKDKLNIEAYFSGQTMSAVIYDVDGRLIQQAVLSNGINTLSLTDMRTGIYILKVTDSNGSSRISKVTVER
jgi:hypothetical protein